MDVVQKVTAAIEPPLVDMGYRLVLAKLGEFGGRRTLTVMVERHDEAPVGVEDCTAISRRVGAILDVEDPLSQAYDLEVCSPGIDRPLTRLADYEKYQGARAKIETYVPLGGSKKFKGTLQGVEGQSVKIQTDRELLSVDFSNIRQARLAVSEDLFKKSS